MNTTSLIPIGLNNPAEIMQAFQDAGNDTLIKLREVVTSPFSQKKERAWGIVDAAKMVGISVPTLRKLETKDGKLGEPARDDSKRRAYSLKRINQIRDILGTRYQRAAGSDAMVVAIANFKGGSGKTTQTINLASKCAIEGLRTLVIDFDPQGSSTFICGGVVPDLEIDAEDTLYDALLRQPADIKRIIRKTNFDGLDIIPANLALQDIELALPNNKVNNSETLGSAALRLKRAIEYVKSDYDVILIDCGPNLGVLTINAILASNGLLVPIPPSMFDYASFIMLTGTLKRLFEAVQVKSFDFFRILLTKHSGSKEASQVENMIRAQFGQYVLSKYMCSTVEMEKASNDLGTIYEITKPRGSRKAYLRAMDHMDNVNNEVIDYFKQIWDEQSATKTHQPISAMELA